jgi:putative spermidine/putrescine transport system substrate-binding protein
MANTSMFAPYQVATWKDIPDNAKDPKGTWVYDYAGYMSVGYDSAKVPAPTSIADLLKGEYKGKVALNGDPTKAGAAFAGVQMVSIGQGGTAATSPRVSTSSSSSRTPATSCPSTPTRPRSSPVRHPSSSTGPTTTRRITKKLPTWKTWIPDNAVLAGYYIQAINADAPHPAAARLWQEYLYSDEGQNLWLKGAAFPVRYDAMKAAGTARRRCPAALPGGQRQGCHPDRGRRDAAKAYLTANWAKAVG